MRFNNPPFGGKKKKKKVIGFAVAGLLAFGGAVVFQQSDGVLSQPKIAHALTSEGAPGWRGKHPGSRANELGSMFHENGEQVYCLELGTLHHDGPGDAPIEETTSVRGSTDGFVGVNHFDLAPVEGNTLRVMRWLITRYGATRDDNQAAAVQLAVWIIRGDTATGEYAQAIAQYEQAANEIDASVVTAAHNYVDTARAAIQAEDDAVSAGVSGGIVVEKTGAYQGTVTVPQNTSWLAVENGELQASDGSWVKRIDFPGGRTASAQSVMWRGKPGEADAWNRYYRVRFSGELSRDIEVTPASLRIVAEPVNQVTYSTVQGVPEHHVFTEPLSSVAVDPDTVFIPVVSSKAPSEFVKQGDKFSDGLVFGVAKDSNPWRERVLPNGQKQYAPIKAHGTLYGPFLQDPALNPQGAVPKGSPVVGSVDITTDVVRGPGDYSVPSDFVSKEAGYYTWVWEIRDEDQLEDVKHPNVKTQNIIKTPALPEKYYFTDGFGQLPERQITPTVLDIKSQVSTPETGLGGSFTDTVTTQTAAGSGGWLQDEQGHRVTVKLRGQAYFMKNKPVQQVKVPAEAVKIGDPLFIEANEPAKEVSSAAFNTPIDKGAGFVTVQWCVLNTDQPANVRGRILEKCDDFGVPSETVEIKTPEVHTTAITKGALKGYVRDIAHVQGQLPPADKFDNTVSFTMFKKPVVGEPKFDEHFKPVVKDGKPVLWEAKDLTDPKLVCRLQPVAKTGAVPVTGVGDVVSPDVKAEEAGVYYWIETFNTVPKTGKPGAPITLHEGECGLPNETTEVVKPVASSKADEMVVSGSEAQDTIIVDGPVADNKAVKYEASFRAYYVADNEPARCEDANKVFESKNIPVAGVGEFKSEKFKTSETMAGKLYWVEQLWLLEDGQKPLLVHEGGCGVASETTRVVPQLAVTGGVSAAGIGVVGAAMFSFGAFMMRRRKKTV